MAVEANMTETYDNRQMIREDLQEAYVMISPEECPFQAMAGRKSVSNTLFDWPVLELASPDTDNRVPEGEQNPDTDVASLANRMSNTTQISDKKVVTSQTEQAMNTAAEDVDKQAQQISIKLREMKRDMEMMLLQNVAASAGTAQAGSTRTAAGFGAFLRTNTYRTAGGADPTLSGTTNGYPDGAATPGTAPSALTEDQFNDAITACWVEGSNPTMALVSANNKRVISSTFTGSSTRYKDAVDKRLVNAIDIYTSDFGELDIVPTRFLPNTDRVNAGSPGDNFPVFIIDPDYVRICFLDEVQQKPLPETGHAKEGLIWTEYSLQVDAENAHAVIADTSGAAA